MADDDKPSVAAPASGTPLKRFSTKELFAGGLTEIRIDHEGFEYRLRITKQNRLILTK